MSGGLISGGVYPRANIWGLIAGDFIRGDITGDFYSVAYNQGAYIWGNTSEAYIQWLISEELISGCIYRGKYPGDLCMGNYIWRTYTRWLISEG